jgi:hypothetical protein
MTLPGASLKPGSGLWSLTTPFWPRWICSTEALKPAVSSALRASASVIPVTFGTGEVWGGAVGGATVGFGGAVGAWVAVGFGGAVGAGVAVGARVGAGVAVTGTGVAVGAWRVAVGAWVLTAAGCSVGVG